MTWRIPNMNKKKLIFLGLAAVFVDICHAETPCLFCGSNSHIQQKIHFGLSFGCPWHIEKAEPWPGQHEFLAKLAKIEESAENCSVNNPSSRIVLMSIRGPFLSYFRDTQLNLEWNASWIHIIKEKNIKPPQDFINYVMSY